MTTIASIVHVVLALLLAPVLPGVINRVKAIFAEAARPVFGSRSVTSVVRLKVTASARHR